jgi:hypothetical protein
MWHTYPEWRCRLNALRMSKTAPVAIKAIPMRIKSIPIAIKEAPTRIKMVPRKSKIVPMMSINVARTTTMFSCLPPPDCGLCS